MKYCYKTDSWLWGYIRCSCRSSLGENFAVTQGYFLAQRSSSIARSGVPQNRWRYFVEMGEGWLWHSPPRLPDVGAPQTVIALNFHLIISRLLAVVDQHCWYHVKIMTNPGCLGILKRGETTHARINVRTTHPTMIDNLNNVPTFHHTYEILIV